MRWLRKPPSPLINGILGHNVDFTGKETLPPNEKSAVNESFIIFLIIIYT